MGKEFYLSGKDYLNAKEAAHYCGVSFSQFRKQASKIGIPALPGLGVKIYRKADLKRAIENINA